MDIIASTAARLTDTFDMIIKNIVIVKRQMLAIDNMRGIILLVWLHTIKC
jgi:hypothetical protein